MAVVSCPERSTVRTVRPPIRNTAVPTDRMATGRQRPLLPTGCSVSRDPSEYWLVDGTARHATLFGSFFLNIYLFVMNLESCTLENVLSWFTFSLLRKFYLKSKTENLIFYEMILFFLRFYIRKVEGSTLILLLPCTLNVSSLMRFLYTIIGKFYLKSKAENKHIFKNSLL